jgi:hypothetical protein
LTTDHTEGDLAARDKFELLEELGVEALEESTDEV